MIGNNYTGRHHCCNTVQLVIFFNNRKYIYRHHVPLFDGSMDPFVLAVDFMGGSFKRGAF